MPRKKADISNQLTENMLNAVGVIRAGQKNTFIYVNPTFIKFTGYTEKELLNMSPFDLVHPDMFEVIVKRFKDRLKGKKVPERYETKILTKKGETLWAEVFAKKINYEGIPAVLIVASEISERKLAEQELHNMRFLLDSAQRLAHLGSIEFE
ncbi:MAG: PAS domain S-box protein, partial [Calditrichaceae bacterium]